MDIDISALVEESVEEACVVPRRKPRPWGTGEEEFLRENYAEMSDAEIGEALGRSADAVAIYRKRNTDLPGRMMLPGQISAHQAAEMLGVDGKAVIRWIENDVLDATLQPLEAKVWSIDLHDLRRFVIRPENWVRFTPQDVPDDGLRRLATLAKERWGDEWWSVGEVAEFHGCTGGCVSSALEDGRLPFIRYGNRYVRRSDAHAIYLAAGRGQGHRLDCWSGEGDAFLLLARAVGHSWSAVAALMDWPKHRVAYRWTRLIQDDQVEYALTKYGLLDSVLYDADDETVIADWRRHRRRFPALASAMAKFAAGEPLTTMRELNRVRSVLWHWSHVFLGDAPVTRSLRVATRRTLSHSRLEKLYRRLCDRGLSVPLA